MGYMHTHWNHAIDKATRYCYYYIIFTDKFFELSTTEGLE